MDVWEAFHLPVNIASSWWTELVVRKEWSARMIRFGQWRYILKRFQCHAIKIFVVTEVIAPGILSFEIWQIRNDIHYSMPRWLHRPPAGNDATYGTYIWNLTTFAWPLAGNYRDRGVPALCSKIGKGTAHYRTVHQGPNGDYKYRSILYLTPARNVCSTKRTGRFNPGKCRRHPLHRRRGGQSGKSRPHRDSISGPSSP